MGRLRIGPEREYLENQIRHQALAAADKFDNIMDDKQRAPRNRTLNCSSDELRRLSQALSRLEGPAAAAEIEGKIINQDLFEVAASMPTGFADLVILDPPYNLVKNFHGHIFKGKAKDEYAAYFGLILDAVLPALKPHGTVYVCSDWRTSMHIAPVLEERLCVRNRITWEREKGRGAKVNWKNNTEDIWFCTSSNSDHYVFNVDAVKVKRKVIAPYRDSEGKPKDWDEDEIGKYRLTHPSNIWTDITIPFWSMPENTDHPTQKPEKLFAKLILASTDEGGVVYDPFLGSGTTAVVCKKLGRRFVGIEQNTEYCCWALKRLVRADADAAIQGYSDGVFWERNSLVDQKAVTPKPDPAAPKLLSPTVTSHSPELEKTRRSRRKMRKDEQSRPQLRLFSNE